MFEPAEPVSETDGDVLPGQTGWWGDRQAAVDQDEAGCSVWMACRQVHGHERTHRHSADMDSAQAGGVEDEREIIGMSVHGEGATDVDAVGPAAQIRCEKP